MLIPLHDHPPIGRFGVGTCQRGLTLLELVVVLVVLVALGGLLIPLFDLRIGDEEKTAQEIATEATLTRVAEAIVGPGGYAEAMTFARDTAGNEVGVGTGLPWPGPSEVLGGRANHPQLHYLFIPPVDDPGPPVVSLGYDPVTRIGWRDEWLSAASATAYPATSDVMSNQNTAGVNGFVGFYGIAGDLAPIDGWGNPVVIQLPEVTGATAAEELEHVRLLSAGPDGVIDTPADELAPLSAEKNDDVIFYLFREDPNP